MEPVTETRFSRIKNFIDRNSTTIAVATTATLCLVANRIALKQHDEFLKEKGLYDEYYTPSDEAMGY